jgi:hypothetical protein
LKEYGRELDSWTDVPDFPWSGTPTHSLRFIFKQSADATASSAVYNLTTAVNAGTLATEVMKLFIDAVAQGDDITVFGFGLYDGGSSRYEHYLNLQGCSVTLKMHMKVVFQNRTTGIQIGSAYENDANDVTNNPIAVRKLVFTGNCVSTKIGADPVVIVSNDYIKRGFAKSASGVNPVQTRVDRYADPGVYRHLKGYKTFKVAPGAMWKDSIKTDYTLSISRLINMMKQYVQQSNTAGTLYAMARVPMGLCHGYVFDKVLDARSGVNASNIAVGYDMQYFVRSSISLKRSRIGREALAFV